jgi:hypothetical protein
MVSHHANLDIDMAIANGRSSGDFSISLARAADLTALGEGKKKGVSILRRRCASGLSNCCAFQGSRVPRIRRLERFDTRPLLADHDRFLGSKALWPCRSLSIPATAPASSARRSGAVAIVMPCSFAVSGQRVADGDTGAVVLILQVIVLEPKSSATGRSLQREATRHVRQAGMAHFPFVSASESLYAWYGNHSRKQ